MDADDEMTYEEFGRKFFEVAVTEDRVGGAIGAIAGDGFEMGPIGRALATSPRSPRRSTSRTPG